MQTLMSTFSGEPESHQDLNFFQDDNDVPKKKIRTAKSSYSNTRVKARHLSTNVMYRRYKQQDFNNASFVMDVLSFLVQNFIPINLDRQLDNENEVLYVRMLWDKCLPHAMTRFIYLNENYNILGDPKLTYQKANTVVKKFIEESSDNINLLKIELEEHFKTIHQIYSLLYPKIYNRVNVFGIKNKNDFDFVFQSWKAKRQNGPVGPKIINELLTPTNQLLVTKILSKAKDPKDYQKGTVNEFEQVPLVSETVEVISNADEMPMQQPIAPAQKYMKDRVDGSARKTMDNVSKRRVGKKNLIYKDN